MGDCRGNWRGFRRALYYRSRCNGHQGLLDFARPGTILYTNLGMGEAIDEQLKGWGRGDLLEPEEIIGLYQGRGRDELVHRALKDFGFEELPFKCLVPNAAFYYTMLTAFFLFEAFKEDVCADVVGVGAYATTVRRRIIDIAAKIVRHGGQVILKVTEATYKKLNLAHIWQRSNSPPRFCWA